MSNVKARRHYRVAKKEIEQSPAKGMFITTSDKNQLFIYAVIFMMIVFIKGLVIGYLMANQDK